MPLCSVPDYIEMNRDHCQNCSPLRCTSSYILCDAIDSDPFPQLPVIFYPNNHLYSLVPFSLRYQFPYDVRLVNLGLHVGKKISQFIKFFIHICVFCKQKNPAE